jgi:hypothetical protein
MRMRPNVQPVTRSELCGTEMIEKDKWSDHARSRRRQCAPHGEVAKIDSARHDHLIDGITLIGIAGDRIFSRKETHVSLLWRVIDKSSRRQPALRSLTSR